MHQAKTFTMKHKAYLVALLVVSNIFVWVAVDARKAEESLNVYFLDVGQGDAILVESPSRGRVLIDGGKNRKVLSELGNILPFNDRRIDVVMGTHPDADHIGGLPEVIGRYRVGAYIHPAVASGKQVEDRLFGELRKRNIPSIEAQKGMTVNFGDGARLVILFPNQDVSKWDSNDGSIVARLVYGERSFLFTGDAPLRTENILMNMEEGMLDSDVLKAGHHGSRTSTSVGFAQSVTPEYAIISAGKGNSYGHPHKEVMDNLSNVGAVILNTADKGTIRFWTDGDNLKVR